MSEGGHYRRTWVGDGTLGISGCRTKNEGMFCAAIQKFAKYNPAKSAYTREWPDRTKGRTQKIPSDLPVASCWYSLLQAENDQKKNVAA